MSDGVIENIWKEKVSTVASVAFMYSAIDAEGKQKKGTVEAASADAARNILKNQGLTVLSVDKPNALNKELSINIGGKVKAKDLAVFCKQMQSILHAGVTVIQALGMLGEQCDNKKLQNAVQEVRVLVEKGDTLAGAMSTMPDVFPPILINMVEAGEASGSLETTFERMAVQFDKDNKIQGMVKQAMIYPCVLLVVIIGVVAIMLIKVVPQFQTTFDSAGGKLPAITLAVVAISNFLISKWYFFIVGIIALVIGIKVFMGTDRGAVFFGTISMKAPVFGDLTIKSACSRFTRTLATLMASGIPMVRAIEIVSKTMSNRLIQVAVNDAKQEVERGVALSQPLEDSGIFPALMVHMIRIGEETGNMEEMMEKVADYYDEEVEAATQAVTAILEPLIIVVMAAVVVPIMLAIMAPMMEIYSMAENA